MVKALYSTTGTSSGDNTGLPKLHTYGYIKIAKSMLYGVIWQF